MTKLQKKLTAFVAAVSILMPGLLLASSQLVIPDLIKSLEAEGGQIHTTFKVSEHLNGFAMSLGAEQIILYATPDGQHIFQGALVDNNARNLTEGFADRYLPKPDFSAAVAEFANAAWFETHDSEADKTLYVIHDPRCPYCLRSMDMLVDHQFEKGVRVRWLPVAALGNESLKISAAMLAEKEPLKFQRDIANGHSLTPRQREAGNQHEQSVMNNTQLMRLIQATGTPAYLLVDEKTGTVNVIHGFRPNDVARAWR